MALNEDAIYQTSTQFRKWSFSPEALAAARKATNKAAAERVSSLLKESVETLTVDEELLLVKHFSNKTLQLAGVLQLPNEVAATAVQFVRRFFVMHSCMDYNPQQICTSALFLATKTDNSYISLQEFANKCHMTQETIVAPEFRLMQGLQFAFDVRHPRRALEAGMMLLEDMYHGRYVSPAGIDPIVVQKDIRAIFGSDERAHRLQQLHGSVRSILRSGAILTDAYFLYTPSQIWLGALLAADEGLARFLIKHILEGVSDSARREVVTTIEDCSKLVASDTPVDEEERKRVSKKLKQCLNPETAGLVRLNAVQKREASDKQGNASKKQKVVNGAKEDPFGPSIS